MKPITNFLPIATILVVSGCATIKPPTPEMIKNARTCYQSVQASEVIKAQKQPSFTDSRDYAIKKLSEALNTKSPYEHCDDEIISWYATQGVTIESNNRTVRAGMGFASIPLGILATGVAFDKAGNGGSTGDTWSVNNSRITSKSGNFGGKASSSGTGLGFGNVYDSGQGGIQPRNLQDVSGTGSNSGEEGGDTVTPELF